MCFFTPKCNRFPSGRQKVALVQLFFLARQRCIVHKIAKLGLNNPHAGCYNKENAAPGISSVRCVSAYRPTVQSGRRAIHYARR